jgi:hypothetical protein
MAGNLPALTLAVVSVFLRKAGAMTRPKTVFCHCPFAFAGNEEFERWETIEHRQRSKT